MKSLFDSAYGYLGKPVALLRNRRRVFRHELAVGAIFKNEARYLEEWLRFHEGVGVDHFYLYNNGSTDGYEAVLQPWIDRGIVTLTQWPERGAQLEAYGDCIRRFRNQTRWIAFIDLDEFLFSPESVDLKSILKRYQDVTAIFVYWVLFGSGGHARRPDRGVLESYTRCLGPEEARYDRFDHRKEPGHANYITGWAQDGKSIVNPRLIRYYVIHKPRVLWAGKTLDENRQEPQQRVYGASISHEVLRINHYWSRSVEELTEKVNRGIANMKNPPSKNLEGWLARERELNSAEDRLILETWDQIQAGS